MRARRLEVCPVCGTEFRAGRLACPECGSDANTGWKSQEELDYTAVELPDDEVEGEFDEATGTYKRPMSPGFRLAIVMALVGAAVIAMLW